MARLLTNKNHESRSQAVPRADRSYRRGHLATTVPMRKVRGFNPIADSSIIAGRPTGFKQRRQQEAAAPTVVMVERHGKRGPSNFNEQARRRSPTPHQHAINLRAAHQRRVLQQKQRARHALLIFITLTAIIMGGLVIATHLSHEAAKKVETVVTKIDLRRWLNSEKPAAHNQVIKRPTHSQSNSASSRVTQRPTPDKQRIAPSGPPVLSSKTAGKGDHRRPRKP